MPCSIDVDVTTCVTLTIVPSSGASASGSCAHGEGGRWGDVSAARARGVEGACACAPCLDEEGRGHVAELGAVKKGAAAEGDARTRKIDLEAKDEEELAQEHAHLAQGQGGKGKEEEGGGGGVGTRVARSTGQARRARPRPKRGALRASGYGRVSERDGANLLLADAQQRADHEHEAVRREPAHHRLVVVRPAQQRLANQHERS